MKRRSQICGRIAFVLAIFALQAAAILTRPSKLLDEFDQPFYLTIAYDLIHHRVFSNGFINVANGAAGATPAPGMFFGPLYPALIASVTKIDARFAKAVDCGAVTYRAKGSPSECDIYVRPMLLIHALLLTLGVLAVARAAELLFTGHVIFWLTGVLATGALLADANQFSFLMTESTTFSLYTLAMLATCAGSCWDGRSSGWSEASELNLARAVTAEFCPKPKTLRVSKLGSPRVLKHLSRPGRLLWGRSLGHLWSDRLQGDKTTSESLISLALPRGLEPMFSP